MKLSDSYHPYAIVTIVFWSLTYILTRLAMQYFTALSLGFLRYFCASCVLIVYVWMHKIKPPALKDWPGFILSGASGFFVYVLALNKGSETLSASTCSVIVATGPVMSALFANFLFRERLHKLQWIAIGVEFIGVLVLTLMKGEFTTNAGILWMLLAAVATSVYNLMQRKLTQKYSGLQVASYGIFVGTLMLSVFMPQSLGELWHAPVRQALYVAVLGVFASALAYVLWAQAYEKASDTMSVNNYMFAMPFLATLFAFLLAGEQPDFATVAGGAIIIVGVFLFNLGARRKSAPAS